MDTADAMKSFGELWGQGAQAILSAQRTMLGEMAKVASQATGSQDAPDAAGFEAAQRAFAQSWEAATKLSAAAVAGIKAAPDGADAVGAEVLSKIFDPAGWLKALGAPDEALARLSDGPRLSDLGQVERKLAAVSAAWVAVRRRQLEHNGVLLEAWTRAAGEFSKVLGARAESGKPFGSWREALAEWVEIANVALLDIQRSDRFLRSQRETLRASTDLKLAQREVGEFYAEMLGAPTRAELDDVHKALTELRREVRALSRAKRRKPKPREAQGG